MLSKKCRDTGVQLVEVYRDSLDIIVPSDSTRGCEVLMMLFICFSMGSRFRSP